MDKFYPSLFMVYKLMQSGLARTHVPRTACAGALQRQLVYIHSVVFIHIHLSILMETIANRIAHHNGELDRRRPSREKRGSISLDYIGDS